MLWYLEAHEDHVGGELAQAGEGEAGLGPLLQATRLCHRVETLGTQDKLSVIRNVVVMAFCSLTAEQS